MIRSKFLFTTLLLFVILTYGEAQKSILWEITGNGMASPSYLLGTLKFIGQQEYFMPKEVEVHLKKCRTFAIEDQVDPKAQHELNKALHLPEGQTIGTLVGADDYKKLLELFQKEFNINQKAFEKRFARLIPLALSITMTRLSLNEGIKYYDVELLKLANRYKLDAFSLEEINRESQALQKYPIQEQVKSLLNSVNNYETQKKEYKAIEAAYIRGDLDKIFQHSLHPEENDPEFIEEFYAKRNEEWLPKLERMVKDKPSFIAVGVSHLEGEKGLLALLKAKGYDLKAVPIAH